MPGGQRPARRDRHFQGSQNALCVSRSKSLSCRRVHLLELSSKLFQAPLLESLPQLLAYARPDRWYLAQASQQGPQIKSATADDDR